MPAIASLNHTETFFLVTVSLNLAGTSSFFKPPPLNLFLYFYSAADAAPTSKMIKNVQHFVFFIFVSAPAFTENGFSTYVPVELTEAGILPAVIWM